MFISNNIFNIKSTIAQSAIDWTTFSISNDYYTNTPIETGTDTLVIELVNSTQREIMEITATWWTATIVKRWLENGETITENVALQQTWTDWTICYSTALAFNIFNKNKTSWSETINTDTIFAWSMQIPTFSTTTARDTVFTTPVNWDICFLTGTGQQVYSGWAWQTLWVGTPTPNASITVAWITQEWTAAQNITATEIGSTWAPLFMSPKNTAVISSGAWNSWFVPVLNANWVLDNSFISNYGITWEIKEFAWSSAPTWWLIANWSAVSRTTYAWLFAVIGTTYWVWDWSTTFNLPDRRGKVWVGYLVWDANFWTLWGTGWEATHLLSVNEMPSHSHTLIRQTAGSQVKIVDIPPLTNADPTITTTVTTSASWWWLAHNNLQPFLVVNYIIKT